MKTFTLVRPTAAVLGTLLAAAALAQTAPSRTMPQVAAPVVSDAAPLPAEDRSSTGAIVLEQSPVRAQRNPTAVMGASPAVAKPANKALKRSEQRQAREAEAATLRLQGAGSLQDK
jgi:hypothetical protein